jgi:hypothetical protein
VPGRSTRYEIGSPGATTSAYLRRRLTRAGHVGVLWSARGRQIGRRLLLVGVIGDRVKGRWGLTQPEWIRVRAVVSGGPFVTVGLFRVRSSLGGERGDGALGR